MARKRMARMKQKKKEREEQATITVRRTAGTVYWRASEALIRLCKLRFAIYAHIFRMSIAF